MKNYRILLIGTVLMLTTATALRAQNGTDDPVPLQGLLSQYKEARQIEELRIYPKAQIRYQTILEEGLAYYYNLNINRKEKFIEYVPVMSATVVRYTVCTAKNNYANILPLSYQLDSFDRAHRYIDAMLVILSDMGLRFPDTLPQQSYNALLFARGYNRIAWAGKLLHAIPWKDDILVPPADITSMIGQSINDFEQLLQTEMLPRQTKYHKLTLFASRQDMISSPAVPAKDNYHRKLQESITHMGTESGDYQTLALLFNEEDTSLLAQALTSHYYDQVYEVVDFCNSPKGKDILQKAALVYTLEDIKDYKNRDLFRFMNQLLRLLVIRT